MPADLWLGKREGWAILTGLGQSGAVGVVLLGAAAACCSGPAERKLVVQGG